jgi:hypothetical protein
MRGKAFDVGLTPFADPHRLFGCLKRVGLASDSGVFGAGSSPLAIEVEAKPLELLRDALVATLSG